MDTTTRTLCDFTRNLRYEDLPAIALVAAKSRILSTLAVALAAYDMAPVRIVRKLAQPVAAGPAAAIFGSAGLAASLFCSAGPLGACSVVPESCLFMCHLLACGRCVKFSQQGVAEHAGLIVRERGQEPRFGPPRD